jgi:ABC-type Fe3+/spermidine/putrescine transport system ATPase subunit
MSSLDSPLKAELSADLIELQRLLLITTIYITHDRIEAVAVSHRIAIMQKGRIEQVGTAEALRSQPATETVARFMLALGPE